MPPLALPPSEEDNQYTIGACADDLETIHWRYDHLVGLGVEVLAAVALSHVPDSWHNVERLLRLGCPVDIAASILL